MTTQRTRNVPSTLSEAVEEVKRLIAGRYPDACFGRLLEGVDDPEERWLEVTLDLDDPFEAVELVSDLLLDFLIERGIPLYVFPLRTPEREAEVLRQLAEGTHRPPLPERPGAAR